MSTDRAVDETRLELPTGSGVGWSERIIVAHVGLRADTLVGDEYRGAPEGHVAFVS
jgi:hypothetical protein